MSSEIRASAGGSLHGSPTSNSLQIEIQQTKKVHLAAWPECRQFRTALSLSITFPLQYCECAGISKLTPVNREDIILFRPLALVMFNPTFSPDSLGFGPLFFFFAFLFYPSIPNCNLSATTICHLQFLSSSLRIFFCF